MDARASITLRLAIVSFALALPALAGSAAAQGTPVAFTPNLMLSNDNRHPVGVLASIEGGADTDFSPASDDGRVFDKIDLYGTTMEF
jgi:hypothetical protein